MAWQDEMVELVRVMVGDMTTPFRNINSSMERVIVGAARLVNTQLSFPIVYNADLSARNIEPDPTDGDAGTRDDNYVNLVCMKAAAIIDQGSIRAESGIVIRDNGSMVDLHYKLDALVKLVTSKGGWAAMYEDAKLLYAADALSGGVGVAVLGPFRDLASDYYGWEDSYRVYR